MVNALHHGRILDEVSNILIIGPPGQLDVAGPFEMGTIAYIQR
ncbi:MAG: hypothetical protein WAM11_07385 [Cyanobium sp.]